MSGLFSSNKKLTVVLLLIAITTVALFGVGCAKMEKTPQTVLLISVDGFRWDYFQKADTPNLDKLIEEGVKAESLKPVFPSKTFPNHYTIVTGLYPEHHGIVSNRMYDPNMNAYFSLGDRNAVSDGRWYGGEPLWVTAEKQNVISATYFWPGSEAEIEGIRPSYWKEYNGRTPNSERISQILKWLELPEEKRPRFLTLYFSDTDNAGHRYGPDSPEVVEAIRKIDQNMGELIAGLKARDWFDKINIIITSDHGMTATSKDRVIFLDNYISLDDVDVIDWSPVLALRPKEGKLEAVYQALKNANSHLAVYKKEEIPERFHYRDNPRITPIIAIADEGWSITSHDYYSERPERYDGGAHGYDNELKSMQGIFIARGPAFKSGLKVPTFMNIHIYEMIAHILDIKPAPNDGSLDSVKVMLR